MDSHVGTDITQHEVLQVDSSLELCSTSTVTIKTMYEMFQFNMYVNILLLLCLLNKFIVSYRIVSYRVVISDRRVM